ncbi:secretoglobin, family 2B, member 18 isoform X1 [Mus musculus]|uniref:secretoglobin, family 2B, member 18 isoform X1 n=1 Tax=Mus musculus TaxID=10090 RepID=UPI0003D739A0|nr:secretoglobin, family 2B, member 18 isoform X1 [Mus musculus]|eukprot:XP_006540561.1 PREDICTED: secretoglobin, family 2B, member 18 isoform X1 [Mus musculus]
MKGTLLLLGLLVTGELSFQTSEACVSFFEGYASVLSGSRVWLYQELQAFDATAEEKEAMVASPECRSYHSFNNFRSILDFISNLLGE